MCYQKAILFYFLQVLRRPYLRSENRASFCSMNDLITQEFIKSLSSAHDILSSNSDDDIMTSSWMLLGYSCQLEYAFLVCKADTERSSTKTRKKILNFLPGLCSRCLLHLRQTQVQILFLLFNLPVADFSLFSLGLAG